MKQYIGCDTHLRYSVFRILSEDGVMGPAMRVEHGGGELERFLAQLPAGSPVADNIALRHHGPRRLPPERQSQS